MTIAALVPALHRKSYACGSGSWTMRRAPLVHRQPTTSPELLLTTPSIRLGFIVSYYDLPRERLVPHCRRWHLSHSSTEVCALNTLRRCRPSTRPNTTTRFSPTRLGFHVDAPVDSAHESHRHLLPRGHSMQSQYVHAFFTMIMDRYGHIYIKPVVFPLLLPRVLSVRLLSPNSTLVHPWPVLTKWSRRNASASTTLESSAFYATP